MTPDDLVPPIETSHLLTLLAVATHGSFQRAAHAVHIGEGAVAYRIGRLEESVGALLVNRSFHGTTLTPAGRAIVAHARRIAREALTLVQQAVDRVQSPSTRSLGIASTRSIAAYILPDVLGKYAALNPQVRITVRSGRSHEILDMVLRGDAELGLTRGLEDDGVESVILGEDSMVLAAGAASKARDPLSLSDVAELPLILLDRGASDWRLAMDVLKRAGKPLDIRLEVQAPEAAKRLLRELPVVALLPGFTIRTEVQRGELRILRVVDAAFPPRRFVALRRRGTPTVEAGEFLATLTSWIGTLALTAEGPRGSGRRRRGGLRPSPAPKRVP